MVLPDTSVWVDFSRHGTSGDAGAMRSLLDEGRVVVCGSVAAEVLAGLDDAVGERMWETLSSLPWVELAAGDWQQVGAVARRLRQAGQKLPLTDLAIAVAAARAGHALWSFDADFERIGAALEGFELYAPPA